MVIHIFLLKQSMESSKLIIELWEAILKYYKQMVHLVSMETRTMGMSSKSQYFSAPHMFHLELIIFHLFYIFVNKWGNLLKGKLPNIVINENIENALFWGCFCWIEMGPEYRNDSAQDHFYIQGQG